MAEQPRSVDPLIETPPPPAAPSMDYPSHIRTYNRFLHLSKWFIIHMVLLLPSLYFFIVGENAILGTVLLLAAIGALIYGIVRMPEVKRDLKATLVEQQP